LGGARNRVAGFYSFARIAEKPQHLCGAVPMLQASLPARIRASSRTHGGFDVAIAPLTPAGSPSRRRLTVVEPPEERHDSDAPVDRDYWLAHCEGYRVDAADGRIGFVEDVRLGPAHPHDTVLAVRAGRLGRRLLLVPAEEAAYVVPRAERIWLRTPVTIAGSEST
jgi:hypothetical protein